MPPQPSYQELLSKISLLEKALAEKTEKENTELKGKNTSREGNSHIHLMKTLLDTIPSPVYFKDTEGIYLGCNLAFSEQILGIPADQIIGRSLFDLPDAIPTDLAEIYYKQDRDLITHPGTQFYENQVQCADDQRRDYLFYKATYTDDAGAVAGIVGLMLDVTQKNQIQLALKESEEKYRSMMESMNDPAYICSPDLKVSYMNPAMIRATGYDASGEKCHRALHNLDAPCPWCIMDRVQKGEAVEAEVISPKDNKNYHVSNSPIFHQDGTISKITIFRDITAIKEIEKELLDARRLEAVGILAGGIAHDFNNLFTIIMGNILIAKKDVAHLPRSTRLLKEAEKASKKAIDLTRRLLALVRDDEITLINTSVVEIIDKANRNALQDSKIRFQTTLPNNLWLGHLDPNLTLYTIENIFRNAVQAMPAGGILGLSAKNTTIEVPEDKTTPLAPGKYIHIEIRDEGVGIKESDLEKVFDPYYSTQKRGVEKGMGLGLSTSRSIINRQHGEILIESEEGVGTRVHIYLPAAE